jgi:hypothetical protein
MTTATDDRALVAGLSQRFVDELALHAADEAVDSATWPTVGALAGHVANIYGWVTEIVRTGEPSPRSDVILDDADATTTVTAARAHLVAALDDTDPTSTCWIIGGGQGSPTFWNRRMVFETMKHLVDLRGAGSSHAPLAPVELTAELAADGIDEFFAVFLARSRSTLPALPGSIAFVATDGSKAWSLTSDWTVGTAADTNPEADAVVRATAADLLLLLWERADALTHVDRFSVDGDRAIVAALEAAPIHP